MFFMILGILFILYYLGMALLVGRGSNFYLIWLLTGVALLVFGILIRKGTVLSHMPVMLKRICLGLLCVGGIIFLTVEGFIISGFTAKGEENLDAVVVLGAQMKREGPSRILRMRLDRACRYLEENPETVVIVSGGQGKDEPVSEAQGMYDYLVEKGIAPERIMMEDRSRNTKENISYSSAFLDMENNRVGLVTSNFHVFRATRIARKAGYKKVCGIAAPSDLFLLLNNTVREFFGVGKDWIVGNM